nr:AT-hook motif nuclear-localized protein 27-like [Setaria viridis]
MPALAMAPASAAAATGASPEGKQQGVLEVAPGADVSACVAEYARRRGCGVYVLGASGAIADVAVRGAAALLRGRFELLSVTGTVLPPLAPPEAGADGESGMPARAWDGVGKICT